MTMIGMPEAARGPWRSRTLLALCLLALPLLALSACGGGWTGATVAGVIADSVPSVAIEYCETVPKACVTYADSTDRGDSGLWG